MAKKRVFSGTRATGRLHLGNYLGAVKGYIELQNNPEYECVYMAVDLHTITTPFDHKSLPGSTRAILLDYLSAGLDPEKAIITAQSYVPEHTYLSFLFSSAVTVARMQHLPTFKEKVKQHPENVTMALLNYAVLMAADILIYKAELVPAGVDQEPHIEVTREIARKMNETYGTDFPKTQRFSVPGEYVPSLLGEGKMSKSVEGSYINLTDGLEIIKAKLAKVPTDSGRGGLRILDNKKKGFAKREYLSKDGSVSQGVGVLMRLVDLIQGDARRREYEKQYKDTGIRYGELKEELAGAIFKELQPIQKRRLDLERDNKYIDRVIREGAEKARTIAKETVKEVKEKMGLI